MKTLNRINIIIILLVAIGFKATAQLAVPANYGSSISYGLETNMAVGPVTQDFKTGPALVVRGEYHMTGCFNLTGSVGLLTLLPTSTYAYYLKYNHLGYKTDNFIPLKVGGKYYLTENWYTEAETGAVLYTSHYTMPALALGAGTGVSYIMDNYRAIDFGIHFENWTRQTVIGENNVSQLIGLRVAYKFGL